MNYSEMSEAELEAELERLNNEWPTVEGWHRTQLVEETILIGRILSHKRQERERQEREGR